MKLPPLLLTLLVVSIAAPASAEQEVATPTLNVPARSDSATSAQAVQSGTKRVVFKPRGIFGVAEPRISLPSGLDFAKGGSIALKACETCPEPNKPSGVLYEFGGS